jgi:hypothetical protein
MDLSAIERKGLSPLHDLLLLAEVRLPADTAFK